MAGNMTFVPRVVINESRGVTEEVREIVSSLECTKVVKNSLGGGSRVELKLKSGKPLTILAPLLDITRGASTTIPKYEAGKRAGESSAKPSMVLHLDLSKPGNKELKEFLDLLDERSKAICVEKIADLETNKKLQNADHLEASFNAWDKKAKESYMKRNAAIEGVKVEDAPLFLRVKIMSRKDSDFHNPANWLVHVKHIDDAGNIKSYEDAGELKKGGMKVQAGLEVNCIMKSSEGYALDVQLREVLILERTGGGDGENAVAMAEMDPGVAAILEKKRKAAAAKAADEANAKGDAKVAKPDDAAEAPATKKRDARLSDDDSDC